MQYDEQIARRSAVHTGLTFTRHAETRSSLDPCGNLYLERFFFFYAPRTATTLARIPDDLPFPLAVRTRSHDAEETLLAM